MNCPHDGCEEQIGYDQYDIHIDQCQFKCVICEHCNQEYQKIFKDDHEANCLDLVKLKILQLSGKLDQAHAELENMKITIADEREKSATELSKARSKLKVVKSELEYFTRKSSAEREQFEVATARVELESIKSHFQNVIVLPAGFKHFENGLVFATKIKKAPVF